MKTPRTLEVVAGLAALLTTIPSHAAYKCTNPNGTVSFQDAPCVGSTGRQFEIKTGAPPPSAAVPPEPAAPPGAARDAAKAKAPAKRKTEAERLEELTAASQRDRRRWDLRDRLLPGARTDLANHTASCANEQARLLREEDRYVQNMYGKTHAAQQASARAAVAATCDTQDRELRGRIEQLEKECKEIECLRE